MSSIKTTTKRKSTKAAVINKPKKPRNAYTFFVVETRPTVKAENPEADFTSIGKLMGVRWNALSDTDKVPYVTMAEGDKIRWQNETKTSSPDSTSAVEIDSKSAAIKEPRKRGGKKKLPSDSQTKPSSNKQSKHGLKLDDPQLLKTAYRKLTGILEVIESSIGSDLSMFPTFEGLLPKVSTMLDRIRLSHQISTSVTAS